MSAASALWWLFGIGVGLALVIDLGVVQRRSHEVSFRQAGLWLAVWVAMALAFCGAVHFVHGREKALQFLTGYLLEESLSVDNMFVFVMIFHYFDVRPAHQARVLHWGILGAVVMRFLFIYAGIGLVEAFHWMLYVFGALLIFTGAKMAFQGDDKADPSRNPALRLLKKVMPISEQARGELFFERIGGALHATPLFAALLVIEFSDVVFALDSIPAVIAVTRDPFVVYTSNIFAILGLRSLYFLLADLAGRFRRLKVGISVVLCFVGAKMLAEPFYEVPIVASLGVIAAILAVSVIASLEAKDPRPRRP